MTRNFKEQTKISWNENKYKGTLSTEEKQVYKSLTREQKDDAVWKWLNDNPIDLLKEEKRLKEERVKTKQLKIKENNESQKERVAKFFATQGIYNPSKTTIEAFQKQQILANFDNFYHAFGKLTFDMEKQATYNYYMTHQKQNFIQIAQNDKIIKQNEEIIELLKVIANK